MRAKRPTGLLGRRCQRGHQDAVRPSGDEAGFRAWVIERRPRLRCTAYLICLDWPTADAVVHQALTGAFVRWPLLVAAGDPDAYARRIIATALLDGSRRPRPRLPRPTVDHVHRGTRPPEGHGDENVPQTGDAPDCADDRHQVAAALVALPVGMRAAVVLRFYDNLCLAQAAEVMGGSIGTVRRESDRGLQHLKKLLSVELPTDEQVLDCARVSAGNAA